MVLQGCDERRWYGVTPAHVWAHPVAAEGAATVPAAEATIVISLRPVVLAVRDGDRLFAKVALRNEHLTLETNDHRVSK
jgi:hypothetical protein